jgi:prophage regulatory protein
MKKSVEGEGSCETAIALVKQRLGEAAAGGLVAKTDSSKQPSRNRPAYNGPRMLRLPAVLAFSGYGRTQLLEAVKRGEFPAPVRLTASGRAIGWIEEELVAWRDARKAARDGGAAQ